MFYYTIYKMWLNDRAHKPVKNILFLKYEDAAVCQTLSFES